ncbi:Crp/Fnr family transcriptional regulator [Serpentinicella alkaliphila]|uniref:CRP/FNR family transcriptional regulator n=1 Tax=Serpentinicella alkaliphila TaxID=1734049 RepID=A0A4R2U7F1_9FIRM|nr:Crp/Fnr family transcriptional regulator [Serpentinicella alkaliphila]QUH24704.1 Crp/Fnr family transcriptional regulator [Serpentinicella alkaliphila]TCQ03693.1 CRP/FNR family transcriptional regulator [Serpentinicella alkaliphila]
MKKTTVEYLKKIPVFNGLNEEDLERISKISIYNVFQKGTVMFMEGDPGEAFYFVKSGKVKIYKTAFDGREHIFTIINEGGVFAEVTLFNNIPYPASAEVLEDSEIGMIKNKDLESLIRQNSDIALQIIKIFSKKLFQSQQKVKELALGDTYGRTAQTILKLAKEHGVETQNGIQLKLDLSRQDLANMIGTARETVSRALSQFKKDGLIDINGKKMIIKDKAKLQDSIN